MKYRIVVIAVICLLILGLAVPVLAAYTGPNRTVSQTSPYWWFPVPGLGGCTVYSPPPAAFWDPVMACLNFSAAGPCDCQDYQDAVNAGIVQELTGTQTVTYPPATVSGTASCSQPGNSGWCRGGASLALSAVEPVSGYTITGVEAGTGMLCSGNAASLNCTWNGFGQGATTLTYWALSSWGDTSTMASSTMRLDSVPPVVSLSIPIPDGSNGWHVTPTTVSATASDATSGVASAQVSTDGTSWLGSLTLADGIYTLRGRAFDAAGNTSSTTALVQVDGTPPTTDLNVSGIAGLNGWLIAPDITLDAGAFDATSGVADVRYRLDGGAWQGSSDFTVPDGIHTFDALVTDLAGNTATSSEVLRVDSIPPDASLSVSGALGSNGWYRDGAITLDANAWDNTSGVDLVLYRADGGTWQDQPDFILPDGWHSLETQVSDRAGWISNSSMIIGIDSLQPSIDLNSVGVMGEAGWYVSPVNLMITAQDATSGISQVEYVINGGSWQVGTEIFLSADGIYDVSVRVSDLAGNIATQFASIRIDTTDPIAEIQLPAPTGAKGWFTQVPDVSALGEDALSGVASVEYSLDGGSTWSASAPDLQEGIQELQVRVTDLAGNVTIVEMPIRVDATPPKSMFVEPAEGSTVIVDAGLFISGQTEELLSGLAGVMLSRDGGVSWQPLSFQADGFWGYAWDTSGMPNGTYDVLVEGVDLAGNREQTARITVVVFHKAPPEEPTPTPTSTETFTWFTPTATPSPTPNGTKVIPTMPQATPTLLPTPTEIVIDVLPTDLPEEPVESNHTITWPLTVISSITLMFAFLTLSDPRPDAIRSLARAIQSLELEE